MRSVAGPVTVYASAAAALPVASATRAAAGGARSAGKAAVAATLPRPGPPDRRAKNRVACRAGLGSHPVAQ